MKFIIFHLVDNSNIDASGQHMGAFPCSFLVFAVFHHLRIFYSDVHFPVAECSNIKEI